MPRKADPPSPPEGGLLRAIGPKLLFFFVLGDVLGGGIYALVGEVGRETGGAIWAAFGLAFVLAMFTAASYAELVTKYPSAGGAAYFVHRAFSRPWLSFIVAFTVLCSGVTSAAALARAFGGDYMSAFIDAPTSLVAIIFLVAVAALNARGIEQSLRVNIVFTLIELAGLLLVIVIALAALGDGLGDPGRAYEFREGVSPLAAVFAGASLAFFALIGFEDSANVAEETKDPRRAYPRALFGGLAVAGLIYLLVTTLAAMTVPIGELSNSSGPLLEVVGRGPLAIDLRVFSAIALFAVANGALINMIMASRLLYGMANEGVVPTVFGRVRAQERTPGAAIVFTTALALVLVVTGDLGKLAETTVTLLLLAFVLVNASALRLKRDVVEHSHLTIPRAIPVLGIATSLGLLTQIGAEVFARAGALLALGAVLWLVTNRFGLGDSRV